MKYSVNVESFGIHTRMPNYQMATLTADVYIREHNFKQAMANMRGEIASTHKAIIAFGAAALAMRVGKAIADDVTYAVESAIDLESRYAQLRKTTGLAGQQLEKLKGTLSSLSTTMAGVQFSDLLDTATMAGKLGIQGDKIANFSRDIGMITVALEDIPAEEAASKIVKILNVFGRGTEDTIRFASALNKLDDTSTATGREILDITRRLSGTASTLGLSPEKVMALSTALVEAGVNQEVAGTSISQVLVKMTTQTQKFADVAGVSLDRFTRMLRADPLMALDAFLKGLSRLDKLAQFQALDDLKFKGQRTVGTLLQLSTVMDDLPKHIKTAESEWKSLNSIVKENEIRGETTAAQLTILKNQLLLMASTAGEFVLPIIKALAGSFGELASDVKKFLVDNAIGIKGFANGIANAARYVGLFAKEFQTIKELGKLFAVEKFEQIVEVLRRVGTQGFDFMKVAALNTVTFFRNAFAGLGAYLTDLFKQVSANLAANLNNALQKVMADFSGNGVSRMFAAMIDKVKPGTLKAFDDIARANAAKKMQPVPDINPDASVLGMDRLMGGMQGLPGFGGFFNNLPNRQAQMAPLQARLFQARQQMEANQAMKRAMANPIFQQIQGAIPRPNLGGRRRPVNQRIAAARARKAAELQAKKDQRLAAKRARFGKVGNAVAGRAQDFAQGIGVPGKAAQMAGNVAGFASTKQGQQALGKLGQAAGVLGGNEGKIVNLVGRVLSSTLANQKKIAELEARQRSGQKRNR